MKKILYLVLSCLICCAVLTSGCVRMGRSFPEERVTMIKIGQTSRDEIRTMFGEPWRLGMEDGQQTWTYGNYRYSVLGSRETSDLVVRFNKEGIVASYSYNTSSE